MPMGFIRKVEDECIRKKPEDLEEIPEEVYHEMEVQRERQKRDDDEMTRIVKKYVEENNIGHPPPNDREGIELCNNDDLEAIEKLYDEYLEKQDEHNEIKKQIEKPETKENPFNIPIFKEKDLPNPEDAGKIIYVQRLFMAVSDGTKWNIAKNHSTLI